MESRAQEKRQRVGGVDHHVVDLGDDIARLQAGGARGPGLVDRQYAASRRSPEQGRGLFREHGARRPEGGDDQLPTRQDLLHVVLDVGGVEAESAA